MGPTGVHPDLEMYFMPVMCQQCESPSCTAVCPTGACCKSEKDGVARIDESVCIGCQACKNACPYEANIFNKELRVMTKCDICSDLREKGESPVCVLNCSGAAIHYGDANDPESDVSKLMKEAGSENVYSLVDSNDNHPNCRVILKNAKWIETLPHEFTTASKGGRRNG
jgi:Fe-S-cluster-containing dehydrogenase component